MVAHYRDIKVGSQLLTLTKIAYQRALDEVAFLEDSSHRDEYTKSKGYAGALLSGYILCGYISHFLVNFFGLEWLQGGEVSLSFVKAVHQGDEVTIGGTVVEMIENNEGIRLNLDIWMEKNEGIKVIVGQANGILKA